MIINRTWRIDTRVISKSIEAHPAAAALNIPFGTFIHVFAGAAIFGEAVSRRTSAFVAAGKIRAAVLANVIGCTFVDV